MKDLNHIPNAANSAQQSESRAAPGSVQAENVQLHQSAARDITADRALLATSAVLQAKASLVEARQSALGLVQANEVFVRRGVTAAIRAENAQLDGATGFVAADQVRMQGGTAGIVAARRISGRQIRALVVIGNQVEGEVHVAFDQRHALLAGLLGGLVGGLILALTRVALRRN